MNTELLKKKILQLAMQGKLVEQDESDGTAEELIDKIIEEKKQLMAEGKIKKEKLSRIYKNSSDNHYYEKFDNGEEKDITNDIPFEIPSNWCWTRIGILEEINLGFTYRPEYTNNGVYFLSVKDISGGKIDFSEAKKVSNETYINASYGSKPYKGDILFGRVGTIGKPQIILEDTPFCIFVSLGFFRDHLNILNKEYICSWMNSYLFEEQVKLKVKGTAQINLNTGWLKDFYIPLPPIHEQNRITKKLEKLEEKIELIEHSKIEIKKNKELLKSKIIDMAIKGELTKQISTDKPASELIEDILEEKRKLIKEGKIKKENLSVIYKDSTDNQFYEKFDDGKIINITKEIPYDIPTNWTWTRMKDICIINPRNTLEDELEVSFVPMTLIDGGYSNSHTFEIKKWKEIKTGFTHFKEGDIGIAKITPCFQNKKSTIFKNLKNGYGSGTTELHILRPVINDIRTDYLFWIIKSSYFIDNGVKTYSGTAGQQRINKNFLPNFLVPIAPVNQQEKIVKKINIIFKNL
ncbi:MAG: restriction endonuclease subunit S [Clostridia bacterium]